VSFRAASPGIFWRIAMPPQVDPEQRAATVARLRQLREGDQLTSQHVRLAAAGLGVSERTVWRWLGEGAGEQGRRRGRAPYQAPDSYSYAQPQSGDE
jgi:hypothetical protein